MKKKAADIVIENAAQILTCEKDAADHIGLIKNGSVAIGEGKITAVGSRSEIAPLIDAATRVIDASGKVVTPGFVDCHTHVVFGGTRVEEYCARLETDDLDELKRRGVPMGIMVTLSATRDLPMEELYEQSAERVRRMILSGTTTIESKSGYSLNTEGEMRQLKINRILAEKLPVDISSTFLGAHGWAPDMTKEAYMDMLIKEMIPEAGRSGLAEACDIWCDSGHYEKEECRKILEAGREHGMEPKIHAGAYSYVGGEDLAAEMKMYSADHLNYTPISALEKLAESGVTGVVLPGIDFAVNHPLFFNPRPMFEAGLELGMATNCCPGCWCTSMPFIISLACRQHGMPPARALRAATYGGACALKREDRIGSIEAGKQADILILDIPTYEDIAYRLGENPVDTVIRHGKISVQNGAVIQEI
ncbi:imidazolonepropionase [Cloacibacillus porcorum]|uniref:Imidazolonepropionase n=1 Tax=Cloacibacillus porcorum TaxID=1197717 RepID=A0A1B2I2U9_9BACT|nr:imidazolonepropionase [Cloacibacillus porcorum]ANZ44283.1 imidazolonepropionase [Cloacibacillus porcorum]